jgi:hypothetical protein
MKAVLLVSVLAVVVVHYEFSMIQQVEQKHLVSCVVTVVQRHFPVGRTIHLSNNGDDEHAKSVLVAIHRQGLGPEQVTGPNKISVSPLNMEKLRGHFIFTTNVKDM